MNNSIKAQVASSSERNGLITAIILFTLCALFIIYVHNYNSKAPKNVDRIELVGHSSNAITYNYK